MGGGGSGMNLDHCPITERWIASASESTSTRIEAWASSHSEAVRWRRAPVGSSVKCQDELVASKPPKSKSPAGAPTAKSAGKEVT